ncbi:hypothetical protein E2562_008763 [Oryza meyeriana var. granulata]|uniref:Uncharacterized protein n=1 Tax=Oryza meyeriana var. granulata TaxID=110450 RepID=A0A6G1CZW3_9ORYZ|nr:hypothetical protein E2562_008763 [Oryza meyeriana var. granulata]
MSSRSQVHDGRRGTRLEWKGGEAYDVADAEQAVGGLVGGEQDEFVLPILAVGFRLGGRLADLEEDKTSLDPKEGGPDGASRRRERRGGGLSPEGEVRQ